MEKAFINWSGGKDCTLALHHILKEGKYKVESLFTSISKPYNRVTMHGVRKELITRQGFSLVIPSRKMYLPENATHEKYNTFMMYEMQLMKQKGISTSIFGDIFLEDLRKYRETNLEKAGMKSVFPLWKRDTKELLKEFIELGYKAVLVCVSEEKLNKEFAGRIIDENFISDLPENVDPCGENGEFHTFVYDGPVFNTPVKFKTGELVYKKYETKDESVTGKGFWFLDLICE